MRIAFALLAALMVLPPSASAVRPEFWRLQSAGDFLGGESEGIAINSTGQLLAGPAVSKIASFPEPFVLSQASDGAGNRFVGTGNEGRVYRVTNAEAKPLFKAAEPEVYALALNRGALYVGTSPFGKIYKVDLSTGSSTTFFDPQEAYIWALVPLADGSLVAGTGVEGRVWKIAPDGKGVVLFDAPETHVRSLAASGTRILAGGAGEGRIYELGSTEGGRALFDSDFTEITAIWIDSSGIGWAAGVSSVLPTSAPPKPEPPPPGQPAQGQPQQPAQQPSQPASEPRPAVDVSVSFEQPSGPAMSGGSSELYRIDRDGFVTAVRKFDREMIYAIAPGDGEGSLLLGTGPLGRIYRWSGGEVALAASLPEKQVVSIDAGRDGVVATTTNSGAAYRLGRPGEGKVEYRSPVKDTGRFSTFGEYLIEGRGLEGLRSSFRSGNTATPDETWSAWSTSTGPAGRIGAPPARYLQWRISADRASSELTINSLTAGYANRNVAPSIDTLAVNDPGVVFINASYPSAPQVIDATNPDEYGIFSSLDAPRERNEQGKRLFRKGYRTITWKATDANGDALRYSVALRPRAGTSWLRLRDNIEETQINFDTSQLPDGIYEVRLVATDAHDNPTAALTDDRAGVFFTVDNTVPSIAASRSGDAIVVTVRDALSPLSKAEYAIDAKEWVRIQPADGLTDSQEEEFRLPRTEVEGKFVIFRVVDSSWNVASSSVAP
ncbi:MAG TPA: hypothetical protein VFV54_04145 [Thermoanaerobaculia bacterium]|nr:hypothetical protein [Thermoanaerobaculia bacterium]